MKISFKTSEDYFNKLNLIFHTIIAATLLPFALIFLRRHGEEAPAVKESPQLLITIVTISVALTLIFMSFRGFKKAFKHYSKNFSLREKLEFYYKASISKYLKLGLASVMVLMGYVADTHKIFIVFYLFVIFLFSLGRPAIKKLMDELALNEEERKIILAKEAVD